MKLFVTGAGGFLGAAVVEAALAAGHQVTAVIRRPSPRLNPHSRLEIVTGDLADHAALPALLEASRPQVVVHAAWAGLHRDQRQSFDQFAQVETCWRLSEAAARAGAARFVGIGSQDEYGPTEGPVAEDRLARPVSAYGAAKLAAATLSQHVATSLGMTFAWMRLFATYGPGDAENWLIPSLARQMLAGQRPRTTPGTQCWDYLFIDDAARGVLAVVTDPGARGIINLSSGTPVEVRRIVEAIRDAAAPTMELVFGEIPFPPHQIMRMEGRNERLRQTGWAPRTTLAEGIAATVSALRDA